MCSTMTNQSKFWTQIPSLILHSFDRTDRQTLFANISFRIIMCHDVSEQINQLLHIVTITIIVALLLYLVYSRWLMMIVFHFIANVPALSTTPSIVPPSPENSTIICRNISPPNGVESHLFWWPALPGQMTWN